MRDTIRKTRNSVEVSIEILLVQEGEYFVAYCPALELSSYGKTEQKARKAFDEALEIFFEETDRLGTLEKFLLKQGWRLQQVPEPKYIPPKIKNAFAGTLLRSFKEPVKIPV